MYKILTICSIVALAGTVPAQTVAPTKTIPTGFLTKAGFAKVYGGHRAAWGWANGRMQNFYSPAVSGTSTGSITIRDLWIRPVNSRRTSQTAHTFDIEILISSKGVKYAAPSMASFAGNHGTDKKVFFKRAKINFPATTGAKATPYPWKTTFKGVAPFIALKGAPLCIDVKGYNAKPLSVNWYCDSHYSYTATNKGSYKVLGAGCPSTFSQYSRGQHARNFTRWRIYGYTGGPGDLAVNFLGTKPANIKITGTCTLFTLPVVVHPKISKATYSSGSVYWDWVHITAGMAGRKLISQLAAVTPKGVLIMSHGLEITFGTGKPIVPPSHAIYGVAYNNRSFNPDTGRPRFTTAYANIFGRN